MPTRRFLVTGGSQGIGAAVVEQARAAGHEVLFTGRDEARIRGVAERTGAHGLAADVASPDDNERTVAACMERMGGVDVLINNAGVGRDAPLTSGRTEHWRETLELNVLALCICTREAVADMRSRGDDGHVIHISSIASHRVPPQSGVYSASKFAVRSLIEGLRLELRELGSDIRVGAISPGFVETEFAQNFAHGDVEQAQRTYSRFKVLEAGDIASTVVHMLEAPAHVQIHDVIMRATRQPS